MKQTILSRKDQKALDKISKEVSDFASQFPLPSDK